MNLWDEFHCNKHFGKIRISNLLGKKTLLRKDELQPEVIQQQSH